MATALCTTFINTWLCRDTSACVCQQQSGLLRFLAVRRHRSSHTQVASGHECCCSFNLRVEAIRSHYASHERRATLASWIAARRLQGYAVSLQLSAWAILVYLTVYCTAFTVADRHHQLRSVSRGDLILPRTRTKRIGPRSLHSSGSAVWNSPPMYIRDVNLTLAYLNLNNI